MGKIFGILIALSAMLSAQAQVVTVNAIEQIPVGSSDVKVAALSPEADFVLLTSGQNVGLTKIDLATGKLAVVSTNAGAGYNTHLSDDGTTVIYRSKEVDANHLTRTSLHSYNLLTGKSEQIVAPTRDLQGVEVVGATAVAVTAGKAQRKALSRTAVADAERAVLSIDNRHLMITVGGVTRRLDPDGATTSYLWPSLSPDGTKVLYYAASLGARVCDLEGRHIAAIGQYRAPKWVDDETIVAMNDKDDGEFYTSSSIVIATLDGRLQTLTDDTQIAMFPVPAARAQAIAYSTPEGEVYLIRYTK